MLSLANLAAWILQTTILVAVALAAIRLLRLDAERPREHTSQRSQEDTAAVHAGMVGQTPVKSRCRGRLAHAPAVSCSCGR